jgi:hypothetical protein
MISVWYQSPYVHERLPLLRLHHVEFRDFFWRAVLSSILVDSGFSVGYSMSLGHRVEHLRILLVPVICRQKLIRG